MASEPADLYPNEYLLWTGSPQRYPIFNGSDLFLVPFSLLWCGFMIFWEVSLALADGPLFMLLFGGLLVSVGLYVLVGRLIVRYLSLRSSRYHITNRRVLVSSTVLGMRRLQSAYLKDLPPPMIAGSAGPLGTIKFGNLSLFDELKAVQGMGQRNVLPPVLVWVDGARQVRDIIATAQTAPTS